MIGDWVMFNGEPQQITGIYTHSCKSGYVQIKTVNCSAEYLEPIPLTVDILKKNDFCLESNTGYVLDDYDGVVVIYDDWNHNIRILVNRKTVFDKEYFGRVAVHELQHALRLCEINKEIIL